jgi:hypothetical protein
VVGAKVLLPKEETGANDVEVGAGANVETGTKDEKPVGAGDAVGATVLLPTVEAGADVVVGALVLLPKGANDKVGASVNPPSPVGSGVSTTPLGSTEGVTDGVSLVNELPARFGESVTGEDGVTKEARLDGAGVKKGEMVVLGAGAAEAAVGVGADEVGPAGAPPLQREGGLDDKSQICWLIQSMPPLIRE